MEKGLRDQLLLIKEEVEKANIVANMVLEVFVGSIDEGSEKPVMNTEGIIGQSHFIHSELSVLNENLKDIHKLLVGSPNSVPANPDTYK